MQTKKVIIIGASSGMGRELAKVMAAHHYIVGIAAPQENLLISLQHEIPTQTYRAVIDVTQDNAQDKLRHLINEMNSVDIVVICAGIGDPNPNLDFTIDKQTIDVDVIGFCAMTNVSMHHFMQQKRGHLVVISSIAGIRGNDTAPAYNASKAFISNYLQGLRKKIARENLHINVTDIKPGFVDTVMKHTYAKPFLMISAHKAAHYIFNGIVRKKKVVYVSPIWRLVAWGIYLAPDWIYNKFE
ncbi:MAG TPA: SDR family NAD(P)-dependent oxidoreductase [Candidatus Babeliales bacterium]|jgi:short-subunit dehydrogenase|nr:SDR family NAD(P)-dependent oxidoreductase [Candidatus Babeliales bacterium]